VVVSSFVGVLVQLYKEIRKDKKFLTKKLLSDVEIKTQVKKDLRKIFKSRIDKLVGEVYGVGEKEQ